MEWILIFLGITVVLPIVIVWLVTRTRQKETQCRTEVMLKAIEAGVPIDKSCFKTQKKNTTIKERLLKNLTGSCTFTLIGLFLMIVGIVNRVNWNGVSPNDSAIVPMLFGGLFIAIGISWMIVFLVGKKMLAKEIEAEEK